MNINRPRAYGQIRADKERLRKKKHRGQSLRSLRSEVEQLDNRICFRASRVQRELSRQVQDALQLSQGELFRSLLLAKADELGITPEGRTPVEPVSPRPRPMASSGLSCSSWAALCR